MALIVAPLTALSCYAMCPPLRLQRICSKDSSKIRGDHRAPKCSLMHLLLSGSNMRCHCGDFSADPLILLEYLLSKLSHKSLCGHWS
jgi:hypothetical protein